MQPDRLIGTTIADRYELIAQLGKGRSGVVFRAKHRQLQRIVAVKILAQDHNDDAHAIARFEREARSAAILNHPNIVTIYDLGLVPNEYAYIVMEFVEGMDLGQVFGTEGRLPITRTIRICSQICSALSHAHNKSVVHRDLKPGNIMLQDLEDYPDFVKIVDFGLAKRVSTEAASVDSLTMDGQVFGTPAYMSPEQCQGRSLDGRSDIYALGCLCFKMLTGSMPITGMSIMDMMHAHIHTPPHTFEEVYSEGPIPNAMQNVVYKALSKDPAQRQQTMAQFRQELLSAMVEQSAAAPILNIGAPPIDEPTTNERQVAELQKSAQAGNRQAQYELAVKLEHGQGVPLSKDGAAYWLAQSAQSGYAQAQFQLGNKLLLGEGCERDASKAVFWFLKAAEQGNEQAAWQLAACYEKGEGVQIDTLQAINWYKFLLSKGHRRAEERLAACYITCLKSCIMVEGLLDWIKTSTYASDPETLYQLSVFLRRTARSEPAEIIKTLSTAAQLGHKMAQYELGVAYLRGEHIPRNDVEGVRWLKSASDSGNLEATVALAGCLCSGLGATPDAAGALVLLQKAVDNDNLQAKAVLGCLLLTGDGAPRNIVRGVALLKEAAEGGDSFAQWKFALCHKSGIGVARDPKKCDHWFAQSAANYFNQGPLWQWTSTQLRFQEALEYFQSLVSAGSKQGPFWLGIALEHGIGTAPNPARALEYYKTAAQRGLPEAEALAATLQQALAARRA